MAKKSFIQMRLTKVKYFDRDIFQAISEGHRKALSKFGAYVRSDAKKLLRTAKALKPKSFSRFGLTEKSKGTISLKRRGKYIRVSGNPSKPGTPPRSVRGQLKKFLDFEYEDTFIPDVVIGPVKLPQRPNLLSKHPVPAIHEQRKSSHAIVRRRTKKNVKIRQRYPQRPYMVPAFEKNKKKVQLKRIYTNVIKA